MKYFSDPSRDVFYNLINEYYDSPIMTKIKDIDDEYSMYAEQLSCLLLNEERYIIAVCPIDTNPVQSRMKLLQLRWISFQARSLHDELPVSGSHQYEIKRTDKFNLSLTLSERTPKFTKYNIKGNTSMNVTLLHTRGLEYEYPNEGNLISALETFQTVLQFV